jgi:hypothetical protein
MEAQVQSVIGSCAICGRQIVAGAAFSPNTSIFPCQLLFCQYAILIYHQGLIQFFTPYSYNLLYYVFCQEVEAV